MKELRKRVLIADDETDIRINLASLFHEHGWDTVEGKDGVEAVALAVTQQPDLVVLDVMMPGLDGFAAFQELRADHRTEHIPVLMLTGVNDFRLGACHDGDTMGRDLGVAPPQAFIEKPMEHSSFFRRVQEALCS